MLIQLGNMLNIKKSLRESDCGYFNNWDGKFHKIILVDNLNGFIEERFIPLRE